jgi:hypothetical protein
MPLLPLPADGTPRLKLAYYNGRDDHSLTVRFAAGSQGAAEEELDVFLTQFSDTMSEITIVSAYVAPAGSDVFNPTTWPGSTTYGAGVTPEINRTFAFSFAGRSSTGRKARLFLYAVLAVNDASFRILSSENADVAAAVAALNSSSAGFKAIDGSQPIWHGYANVGQNDHWLAEVRG